MYKKEKEIREYIGRIRKLCDKVIECLDSDEEYDIGDEMSELVEDFKEFDNLGDFNDEENDSDRTQVFDELQQNAMESLEIKNLNKIPYFIRKRTGEKVIVNRNIFKIGKEEAYVDYCINDNPTISRSHADIIKKPDGFYIKDMGSLNHTFLNGVKLEQNVPRKLENGCFIQLADEVFEWHCD
jgi:predicted component of type VI protein secretion system